MQKPLQNITAPLVNWYEANRRPLPWRQDQEPYHVWISEIMLQQTRIEAVISYYQRFMEALPTVEALAATPEEQLLKLWEGLGYYSRARNLKKAATVIMNEYGGQFPTGFDAWRKLPGVGDYTAGAVTSICFNERVPAVDGNVLRVIARVLGSRKNVLETETKKEVTALLTAVMPERSGAFNEGLMELGELICLPNALPLCGDCPISAHCTARRENTVTELPVRIKKMKRKKEEKTVLLLLTEDGEIALEKRENKGLLAGLYQLPNCEGFLDEEAVIQAVKALALVPQQARYLKEVKHVFTHIDWLMKGFAVTVKEKNDRLIWATPQQLEEQYPLPTAFQKFLV